VDRFESTPAVSAETASYANARLPNSNDSPVDEKMLITNKKVSQYFIFIILSLIPTIPKEEGL
jgi:hypothetical protein